MTKMKLALPLLLVLTTSAAYADTTYDNTGGGSNYAPNTGFYLGGGAAIAQGLNFYAPTNGDNTLSSFSFFLDGSYITNQDYVQAVIAPWNGAGISGPAVYTSGLTQVVSDGGTTDFVPYTFSGVDASLTSGGSYIAFLTVVTSSDNYTNFTSDYVLMAVIDQGSDNLPGGIFGAPQIQFVSDSGTYTTTFPSTWDSENPNTNQSSALGFDAAFQADFTSSTPPSTVTPEPGTLLLLGTGLMGLLSIVRRRMTHTNASA